MSDKLVIGIADMKVAKGEGMLVTYALGSCIGICLHDPAIKLGALVHINAAGKHGSRAQKPNEVRGYGNQRDLEADGGQRGLPQQDDGEDCRRRQDV